MIHTQLPNFDRAMKRIFASIFVCLFAAIGLGAQGLSSMLLPSNPISAAVAGATIARTADAWAVENNAAAMSLNNKTLAIGANYGMWQPKIAGSTLLSFGTYSSLNDRFSLGMSWKIIKDKPMTVTSESGVATGTYTPSDICGNIAFSAKIVEGLSAGVTAKIFSSAIARDMAGTAFGADVSLAWQSRFGLSAGLSVNNIGSRLSYGGASYSMPAMLRAGLAYTRWGLIASTEVDYLFDGALMGGIGFEYGFLRNILHLRAGYHYGTSSEVIASHVSLGFGVKMWRNIELSGAYLTASKTLGNSFLAGLSFGF